MNLFDSTDNLSVSHDGAAEWGENSAFLRPTAVFRDATKLKLFFMG